MRNLGWVIGLLLPLNLAFAGDALPFTKVFTVIFENQDFSVVSAQPFFSKVASQGALLSNFNGEVHPSQGNYIALTSGSTQGVTGDGTVNLSVTNIVDLLEAHGKTWKVYLEDYPRNCFTGSRSGNYVRKHNPFISYQNIATNPARCSHLVDSSELATDVQSGTLPDYSFYVPNLQNDGHDTGAEFADQWFSGAFGGYLQQPAFLKDLLFIATFDESGSYSGNHTFSVVVGEHVKAGQTVSASTNHLTLLRTVEDGLGLGTLGRDDASAPALSGIWN